MRVQRCAVVQCHSFMSDVLFVYLFIFIFFHTEVSTFRRVASLLSMEPRNKRWGFMIARRVLRRFVSSRVAGRLVKVIGCVATLLYVAGRVRPVAPCCVALRWSTRRCDDAAGAPRGQMRLPRNGTKIETSQP